MKNKMRQNSETDLGKYGNSVCDEVFNQQKNNRPFNK